eukprot:gene1573-2209_t
MEVWADLLPKTTDTITRVAELLASVGQSPAELTAVSRTDILALGDSLVARTRKPALASSLAGSTGSSPEDTGAPADSGQISLLSSSGELSSGYMVSNVTSISLYNGTSEDDVLLVHGLEEAFTFTLAFRVPDTHDTQARSDKVAEMDSQTLEHVIDALSGQSSLKADDSDQGNIADADADITAQCAFFYEASRGALVDNAEDARHRAQSSAHPTQSTEKSQRSSRKKRRQTLGDQMAQLATAVDATESNAIFDTIADTAADDDDDSGDRSHSDIGGSKQVEFHANGISPSPHPLDLHPQLKPAQAETCQHEGEPSDAACGNSEAAVTSTADVQNVRADDSAGYTNTASSAQTSGPHAGKIIHVHMDAVAGGMPTCKLRSPSPSTGVTTKAIAPSTLKDDALLPQAAPSLHTLAQQAQQQAIDVLLAAIKDARNEPHIKSGSRFGIKRNSDTHRHTSDGAIGVTESYDPLNSNDRGAAASSRAYDARASHFFDISADAELDIERLDLPDNTYQLSEIASLRARHSATKAAEPMSGAVDNAPRAWTHASRNRTSIANSVVARYDRAGARGRSGSADCDDSAPPEQDQPLLRSSLKSLWRGAGTRLAFLRNFRGSGSARSDGEHGSRSTKKVVRRSILALQRTASQKKATWNPFRAVSASDDTANDANILGGGLTRPALVSGRGSKGASRGIFFKKVRVLNARGLFKAMKINVFRLQLCIPLDYLEQQALDAMNSSETSGAGEAPDDGRGGAQASPQAVAEAMDRDIEPDSHDVDGDAQQQKAGRSVERTTLPSPSSKRGRSSTRSLTWIGGLFAKSNFFWDQGKKSSKNLTVLRTSVSMKQLARHQSHRKSISSLVAQHMQDEWTDDAGHGDSGDGWRQGTESVSSAAENSGHDQERRSELSRVMTGRRSAGQWQKRHLPVERMLGTAIVQAFLSMNTILSKKDLSMQTTLASQLPWQMPCDRPFPW